MSSNGSAERVDRASTNKTQEKMEDSPVSRETIVAANMTLQQDARAASESCVKTSRGSSKADTLKAMQVRKDEEQIGRAHV